MVLSNLAMVDIWHLGHATFRVKGKNVTVVFDPYNPEFSGLPKLKLEADIVCVSHQHNDHNFVDCVSGVGETPPFVVSGPGEYEKSGVTIVGVSSYHDDNHGSERGKNTIYLVTIDDINIVHLGDLGQKKLEQDQVEALSSCDILMIPVGGTYTIEAKDAPDLISQLEPKIIIPMHYGDGANKFNLDPVDKFLKVMGKESVERVPKLSANSDRLPEEPEVVILEVSK